jgi:hypothetical protein
MKTLFQFMTLSVAVLFMACGSATTDTGTATSNNSAVRNSTSTTATTTNGSTSRDNPTTNSTSTVGSKGNGNRNLSINNTNPNKVETVNQVDYDMQRTTQMYTSLSMTDDQINRYETASRASMDAWKLSNAERAMTAQQRLDQQDSTFKAILDASQYKNYQQWVRDNPYRN